MGEKHRSWVGEKQKKKKKNTTELTKIHTAHIKKQTKHKPTTIEQRLRPLHTDLTKIKSKVHTKIKNT